MALPTAGLLSGGCDKVEGNLCIITSNRPALTQETKVRHAGSIRFSGAHWQCSIGPASYEKTRIVISAAGSISFRNGTLLHCPNIMVEAGKKVEISDTSELSANGTSFLGWRDAGLDHLKWAGLQTRGASHGGLGGTPAALAGGGCAGNTVAPSVAGSGAVSDEGLQPLRRLVYGDPLAPWCFGRAAGRSLGGGRIRVVAHESLVLNGTISAAGAASAEAAESSSGEEPGPAAGAGGSVWISTLTVVQPGARLGGVMATATPTGSGPVDFVDEMDFSDVWIPPLPGGIIAEGGCCPRCLCGGGGRVLTEISSDGNPPRRVVVAGGCWRAPADAGESEGGGQSQECRCGSAGTWAVRRYPVSKKRWLPACAMGATSRRLPGIDPRPPQLQFQNSTTLHVDNSHAVSLAGAALLQPTLLVGMDAAFEVSLQLRDAIVVPAEDSPKWTLSGLSLLSDQIGSTLRHMASEPLELVFSPENQGLELDFSCTLQAEKLTVVGAKQVTLRRDAAIDAADATITGSEEIDTRHGSLGLGSGAFELQAQRIVLGSGRLRNAWILATEELRIVRGSRLRTSHRRCDQHPSPILDPCDQVLSGPLAPRSNQSTLHNVSFDIVLVARQAAFVLEEDTEVHAAAVLVCTDRNASIAGLVSARGLGCPPNRGEQPGAPPGARSSAHSDDRSGLRPPPPGFGYHGMAMCGGGGGAHGGFGGDGVQNRSRIACSGTGGQKYDGWWSSDSTGGRPSKLPTWSASGGGGMAGGAGGGIVWVRAEVLELSSNGTSLSARGDDADSYDHGSLDGAGGGAGGSLIINSSLIVGGGIIEAMGGRGGGCSGGGGGGGVIGSAGQQAALAWSRFASNVSVAGGGADASPTCLRMGTTGRHGGEGELLQLGVCQPGQAGIFCAPCPPGTYNPPHYSDNETAESRVCLPCQNKPGNAYYVMEGWLNATCPYACPSSFPPVEVNPNCDDPWTYYFAFFGGAWGVVTGIISIAFLFGFSVSAKQVGRLRKWQRLRRQRHSGMPFHKLDDEASLLFESMRGRHPLADLDFEKRAQSLGVHGPGGTVVPQRAGPLRAASVLRPRKMRSSSGKSATKLLGADDLPCHTMRIYLQGVNCPSDPWRLEPRPPEELSDVIDPFRWETFSRRLNRLCARGVRLQQLAEGVLQWVYLPLAEYLRWRIRLSRAEDVAAFVWSWSEVSRPDQTFWRFIRDNSGRFGLKFGTDWQMTLGFIDVLDYGCSSEDWAVKPRLPMVLVAGGDGGYTAPYRLEYTDTFVQSVSQYLGEQAWHQVLLSFNQLSRLLPKHPTEEDARPLRQLMVRVSEGILHQTDLECHAVIFEGHCTVRDPALGGGGGGGGGGGSILFGSDSRQCSEDFYYSPCRTPGTVSIVASPGAHTPTLGSAQHRHTQPSDEPRLSRRVALVLTQRWDSSAWSRRRRSLIGKKVQTTPGRVCPQLSSDGVGHVISVGPFGLVSPAPVSDVEDHGSSRASPLTMPAPSTGLDEMEPFTLDDPKPEFDPHEGDRRSKATSRMDDSVARPPPLTQPALRRSRSPISPPPWPGRYQGLDSAAARSGSVSPRWSVPSSPFVSPPRSAAQRRGARQATPASLRGHVRRLRMRMSRDCSAANAAGFIAIAGQRFMQLCQVLVSPFTFAYSCYLRFLQCVKPFGGVGRQAGLYLRHRKPRGSPATTLLSLLICLLTATLFFIAQCAVLFGLGTRHIIFFLSLLWPPFADILALVLGVLFVCGAAEGTTVCLFVVASNGNTAVALISRLLTAGSWRSAGILYMLAEYLVIFGVKVQICRLVNLTLAYADADPTLGQSTGMSEAEVVDHEWVRDYVTFQRGQSDPASDEVELTSDQLAMFASGGSMEFSIELTG